MAFDANKGHALPAGAFPNCVGGFASLVDMSGNVEEWIDACDAAVGPDDHCASVGGAYDDIAKDLQCSSVWTVNSRRSKGPTVGFRCCAN